MPKEFTDSLVEALEAKAEKHNVPVEVLFEVFERGIVAWTEDTQKTQEQYAFNRVDSFLNGGLARKLDEDLLDEVTRRDAAKYVTTNTRARKTNIIQRHSQREKSMYHTSRSKEVIKTHFKTRGKNDPHLTNKHGDQLTDRWTAERNRRVSGLRASLNKSKNLGESEDYIANRKAIHDAHAETSRQLAGRERDPELRRIDLHRSKKHEHAARVLDRLLTLAKKKKK